MYRAQATGSAPGWYGVRRARGSSIQHGGPTYRLPAGFNGARRRYGRRLFSASAKAGISGRAGFSAKRQAGISAMRLSVSHGTFSETTPPTLTVVDQVVRDAVRATVDHPLAFNQSSDFDRTVGVRRQKTKTSQ